jgi:hypothetical protein
MVDIEPLPVSLSQRFSGQTFWTNNVPGKHHVGSLRLSDIVGIRQVALWHERRIFAPAAREHGSITA